jgi:glycogen(starch) synthase
VRVLIVSWEFPPLVVGGLGRHVAALARELDAAGHDVRVLTRGIASTQQTDQYGRVRVIRAAVDPIAVDFGTESVLAWAQTFEHSLTRAGLELVTDWQPHVIHAHDWLVAQTSRTLHQVTGAPVVATIHATEQGRQQGWLTTPLQAAIHSVERWLCTEAAAVVTCSQFMADEVAHLFQLDRRRVYVIGNGIDPRVWSATRPEESDNGRLIAFAGRLVHEKGLQELIKAIPLLRNEFPGIRLAVAGSGPLLESQRDRARRYRVDELITWHGQLDDAALAVLFHRSDAVVVPSLYEPFGLVALEAQAAGTPVAVTDTGGLSDLVESGVTGEHFAPENPGAIADAVGRILSDEARASRMAEAAQRLAVEKYSWSAVSRAVKRVYQDVQIPVASTD